METLMFKDVDSLQWREQEAAGNISANTGRSVQAARDYWEQSLGFFTAEHSDMVFSTNRQQSSL